jgi:hypothetical protein
VCAGGPAQGECKGRLIVKTSEFSGTAQASARVAYRGTRTTILVDEADTVAESDIAELGAKADGIIHPREVALFGDPKISVGGRELASSDRNGDGLVWLMLTSKVREKQAVGFFVPTDFDDQSRASNVADILYLAPPADQNPLASTLGTLAHELQHLLNFAAKVYRPAVEGRQAAAEALWLDEGQAHFAEDATGFGVDNVTLLDQELFPTFGQSRLTETDSANDSLRMRAAAYTFVRYLFERKGGVSYGQDPGQITDQGGAALLKALHGSDQQGVANVNASYGPFGGDSGAFLGWLEIMVLDHRGVSSDGRYNFAPLRHDPATGFQTGLLLRGERKGEGGKLVKLGGPLESPIDAGSTSDAIPNAAGKLFLLSGLRGAATAKVSAEDSGFGLLLVRVHE